VNTVYNSFDREPHHAACYHGSEPSKRVEYAGCKRGREFGQGREGDGAAGETEGAQETDTRESPGGGG